MKLPFDSALLTPGWLHLFAIVAVAGLLLLVLRLMAPGRSTPRYFIRDSLVSPAERSFLGCVDSILPDDIRIFAKVRLADLFSVEKSPNGPAWQTAFNKIASKHIDFVLCRAGDLRPLLGIELDDKTHARPDRQRRDAFLDEIFEANQVPLLRFKAQRTYNTDEIAKRINEALG